MSTVVASTSTAIHSRRSGTRRNSWPNVSPSPIYRSKRQCRCAAEQGKPSGDSSSTRQTLSSLDSLLNTQQQPLADGKETMESASNEAVGESDEQRGARAADTGAGRSSGPWWAPPPEQEGKPRTTGTPGGKEGEFLDDSFLQNSLSEARTGGSTKMGEALDIPTVTPRVTYLLLGANLAVYAVGVTIALLQGDDASNSFFFGLAKVNEEVLAGDYWRLVTANFMHAGLLHLGLNTLALAAIGPEAEAVLGYGVFSLIYLLTGASGSVVSLLVSDLTTVGASGSLFGLVGALVAYFVRNSKLQRSGLQVAFLLGVTAANLALGFQPDSMIDNSGHIAGFAAGFYLGYGMGPRFEVVREADIPEGSMVVQPDVEEKQVVIDQTTLLEKAIVLTSFVGSLAVVLAVALIAGGNPVDDIPL